MATTFGAHHERGIDVEIEVLSTELIDGRPTLDFKVKVHIPGHEVTDCGRTKHHGHSAEWTVRTWRED